MTPVGEYEVGCDVMVGIIDACQSEAKMREAFADYGLTSPEDFEVSSIVGFL
jgi:hypothetical protein